MIDWANHAWRNSGSRVYHLRDTSPLTSRFAECGADLQSPCAEIIAPKLAAGTFIPRTVLLEIQARKSGRHVCKRCLSAIGEVPSLVSDVADGPRYVSIYREGYYLVIDTHTGSVVPPPHGHYKAHRDGYLWDYSAAAMAAQYNAQGVK